MKTRHYSLGEYDVIQDDVISTNKRQLPPTPPTMERSMSFSGELTSTPTDRELFVDVDTSDVRQVTSGQPGALFRKWTTVREGKSKK